MSESVHNEEQGLQVVNGEEVILQPSKKVRKSKKKMEQVEGVEKKKRAHQWTDKTRAAFEKCRAARLANIEKRKQKQAEIQPESAEVPVAEA